MALDVNASILRTRVETCESLSRAARVCVGKTPRRGSQAYALYPCRLQGLWSNGLYQSLQAVPSSTVFGLGQSTTVGRCKKHLGRCCSDDPPVGCRWLSRLLLANLRHRYGSEPRSVSVKPFAHSLLHYSYGCLGFRN